MENYIFSGGQRIARRDAATKAVHFYFSDHLGSTSIVTDALGTLSICGSYLVATGEDESDYYPFGGEIVLCNRVPQNYKYNGKEREVESGLDYFGARHYASGFGRWMIPDWAEKPTDVPYANFGNPQSLNLYSYVQNNPTTVGDPDGHDGETLLLGAGAVVCPECALVVLGGVAAVAVYENRDAILAVALLQSWKRPPLGRLQYRP